MTDLTGAFHGLRAAVDDLIVAAARCESNWATPRAPGKWSAAQIVEHVARGLEDSAHLVAGRPTRFPRFPVFLRPIARAAVFNRVLRNGAFPKARTNRAMDPPDGPGTPADARVRLEEALAKFERECGLRASGDTVASATFGVVPIESWVRFQEVHTRHHASQMPGRA